MAAEPTTTTRRQATESEQSAFNSWSNLYLPITDAMIQAAISSSEICALVQTWANATGITVATWTPTDQSQIDLLIDYGNRLARINAGIQSGKYFLQFRSGTMGAAAPPTMAREQYDPDVFPVENFGVVPVIVWVIVGGVVLIGSLWGASNILKQEANRQLQKNQAVIIEADKQIAQSDPATRKAWQQFKQQNADILAEKSKQADQADEGGIFGKIFGASASKGLGIGIAIAAALALFSLARSVTPEKKKMISNPCTYPQMRGGKKLSRKGPPTVWSKDPAKRKRQVAHIAAFYEGSDMAGQLEHYRKQQEGRGWEVAAVYQGKVNFDQVAKQIAKTKGATSIHFDEVPF